MSTLQSTVLGVIVAMLGFAGQPYAAGDGTSPSKEPAPPLSQAAEEFKVLTRDLGMRPESPPNAQEHHGRKMQWHGRIYENFRNDVLDAIPHEVKQNGESVSPLRRNQFGFNISGPVLLAPSAYSHQTTHFLCCRMKECGSEFLRPTC